LVGPNGISTVAQFFDSWADVAPTDARGFLTRFGAPNMGRPTTEDYRTAVVNAEEASLLCIGDAALFFISGEVLPQLEVAYKAIRSASKSVRR
jgi:hypothetical protein